MKLPYPPSSISGELASYLYKIATALNSIPQMSYFSGITPQLSGITGVASNLAVNIGTASNVSRLWIHYGSTVNPDTTSWNTIA